MVAKWCRANNVPIVVLSGGMQPIIRALLGHLVGEAEVRDMQIVSNDVQPQPGKDINDEGGWNIKYHDDRFVHLFSSLALRSLKVPSPEMAGVW